MKIEIKKQIRDLLSNKKQEFYTKIFVLNGTEKPVFFAEVPSLANLEISVTDAETAKEIMEFVKI